MVIQNYGILFSINCDITMYESNFLRAPPIPTSIALFTSSREY
jgi:hypothetical protein